MTQNVTAFDPGTDRLSELLNPDVLPCNLPREAANILELKMRQSSGSTPLTVTSKAAQAVLRQF